ncbi:Translin [Aspergillus flavus]|uniref:Translin n=1 Tax=Aspergillus flavus TaxID=5059 RepID=A0A5N6H2X1_ASPFL|nr:Translin [Aspergillus flavus]
MIDRTIFESLQSKIDEEAAVRDFRRLLEMVRPYQCYKVSVSHDRRSTTAILSRAHSTPSDQLKPVLDEATKEILAQKEQVTRLKALADKHPFYKYNGVWTRELQNLVSSIELCAYLGGLEEYKSNSAASFLTIEEVGKFLDIPVNLKEQDAFHLTIEEYLLALISMVEELSRLAVNSVTLGDYARPVQIGSFIKDLFAGFQLLNLKNDILRKRSDGIKYSVKKVEDVVYDLSLRNLIPKGSDNA